MSMQGIIAELQTLCTANLVPGTVERVYLGLTGEEREIIIDDYPYLLLDDDGEDTIPTETNGMQVKQYNVAFQIGVRKLNAEDALNELLPAWETLEELIFHPDNRRLVNSGAMVSESLVAFPSVETDRRTAGTNESTAWRFRRAIVPYRLAICRGGRHPWG